MKATKNHTQGYLHGSHATRHKHLTTCSGTGTRLGHKCSVGTRTAFSGTRGRVWQSCGARGGTCGGVPNRSGSPACSPWRPRWSPCTGTSPCPSAPQSTSASSSCPARFDAPRRSRSSSSSCNPFCTPWHSARREPWWGVCAAVRKNMMCCNVLYCKIQCIILYFIVKYNAFYCIVK